MLKERIDKLENPSQAKIGENLSSENKKQDEIQEHQSQNISQLSLSEIAAPPHMFSASIVTAEDKKEETKHDITAPIPENSEETLVNT